MKTLIMAAVVLACGGCMSTQWMNEGKPYTVGPMAYQKFYLPVSTNVTAEIGLRSDGVMVWRQVWEGK